MKLRRYFDLEMQARRAGTAAWRLFAAQGGLAASLRRGPVPRLAAAARALAEQRSALADVYAALGAVFPLGLTWSREGRA